MGKPNSLPASLSHLELEAWASVRFYLAPNETSLWHITDLRDNSPAVRNLGLNAKAPYAFFFIVHCKSTDVWLLRTLCVFFSGDTHADVSGQSHSSLWTGPNVHPALPAQSSDLSWVIF